MIKCDQGQIDINGDFAQINTELTVLIKTIYNLYEKQFGSEEAKKMVWYAFEFAFMTKEEIDKKVAEMHKERSDAFFELMEKLFKNY